MKQQNLSERSELFCCSATKENFRNSFGEHASFRSFLTPRKEHLKIETVYSIIPSKDFIIIDARNNHCVVRCAEPNNHIIYRMIKTTLKLYLRTLKHLVVNYCFPVAHKKKYV